jgi:ribose 5-phosphate isomerase B
MLNIAIASDHRGVSFKTQIINYLQKKSNHIKDFGCFNEEAVDYPDFAKLVTDFVSKNDRTIGILICNSGIGMCIAANRNPKIRAVLCCNKEYARLARLHNDANIIVFGAGYISVPEALNCIDVFLNTAFEGGRHQQRLNKLS